MATAASELVRRAREGAGLSARELARRCGVSTSTVTRIERDELNPTLVMLERLLAASGNELVLSVRERTGPPNMEALRAARNDILCVVERLGGANVRVFGSVARNTADAGSDVDLLVDVPPGTGLIAMEQMREAVEALLPWPVDILTSGAAHGRLAHVREEAVPL